MLPASTLGKCNGYFSTNKQKVTCMIELETNKLKSLLPVHLLEDYSSLDQRSVKKAAMLKHLLHVCCYNIKALVLVCKATSEETI